MAKVAACPWLGALVLFCLVPQVKSSACPSVCTRGLVLQGCKCVPCGHEKYSYVRSGVARCENCASPCRAQENQVEVSPCTTTNGRQCRCKPGFYCPSPTSMTCRRACLPCNAGTFSSTNSLNRECQPYTDCTSKGMVVIAEGSSTKDRECGYPTTTSNLMTTTIPSITSIPITPSIPKMASEPTTTSIPMITSISTTTSIPMTPSTPKAPSEPTTTSIPMITSISTTTSIPMTPPIPNTPPKPMTVLSTTIHVSTPPDEVSSMTPVLPSTSHPKPTSTWVQQTAEGRLQYQTTSQMLPHVRGPENQLSWIFVLLLVVFLLLALTCLSMGCKHKTLKNKLEWPGFTFGKHQLQHLQKPQSVVSSSASGGSHNAEMLLPLASNSMRSARGQDMGLGLSPKANQQVTMENNGKGESINNTVGSIFIYSPGMVILGSNSNEKKEEAKENGEEMPLMSVPQQESSFNPQDDFVGVGMQEEFGKELSFPVPATSK